MALFKSIIIDVKMIESFCLSNDKIKEKLTQKYNTISEDRCESK